MTFCTTFTGTPSDTSQVAVDALASAAGGSAREADEFGADGGAAGDGVPGGGDFDAILVCPNAAP